MHTRYALKIGKLSLKLLLAVVLTVYFATPAVAAVVPRGGADTNVPEGRVLAEKTPVKLEDVKMSFKLDKNFVRIAKGQSVNVLASLTLDAPDSLTLVSVFDTVRGGCTGTLIELIGGYQGQVYESDCLGGVDIGAVNLTQMASACTASNYSNTIGCDFKYTTDKITGTTWTKGYTLSFPITLTARALSNLDATKSSSTGVTHAIQLMPEFRLLNVATKNPAFLDLRKALYIQIFDTEEQLAAVANDPPPEGTPANEETQATGQKSEQCKNAEGFVCALNLLVAGVTHLFNEVVQNVIIKYLGPFIETLVSIRTFKDEFASVIYSAWQILRNLGNIFFILAIVAIGVATVFRISGYAVKDVLVKLITGAILINFSLTIAQAILGVADTAQNQFLGPNTGAIRAIINPLVNTNIWANVNANLGDFTSSIQGIISFWVTFAAFVALLGVAFLLFARVVIMWILLMLSPLPYVAMVLPATRSMSKKWWSTFIKWAFMTPIIAFMLNLTATITELNNNGQNGTGQKGIIENLSNVSAGNSAESVALMFAIAGQAIPIAFLYMTIKAATTFGKGTSSFIDKTLEKGASKAFLPAAFLGGAAAGAATKIGSGALAVAKSPFTLAGKGIKSGIETGKLEAKKFATTQQAALVSKIMPTAGAKGASAYSRRFAANIVSGGQLTASRHKVLEEDIGYEKSKMSKDARRNALRRRPDQLARMEAEERAEGESKFGKQIDGEDNNKTITRINDLLDKQKQGLKLNLDEQHQLAASIKKSLADKTLQTLINTRTEATHLADPTKVKADEIGEIAHFYKEIEEVGGQDGSVLATRIARTVNADAIPKGNLHFTTDANDPTNVSEAEDFRLKRVGGKNAKDLAAINPSTYAIFDDKTGSKTGTPGGVVRVKQLNGLAALALEFKDPVRASFLSGELNPDQKSSFRQIIRTHNADLEAAMIKANGGLTDVDVPDPAHPGSFIKLSVADVITRFNASL